METTTLVDWTLGGNYDSNQAVSAYLQHLWLGHAVISNETADTTRCGSAFSIHQPRISKAPCR
jgi:hypothetical protein